MKRGREILDFWFGLTPQQWWKPDEALDSECRERFEELWTELRQLPATSFLGSAEDALAAIILFDQMPRNIFRGHADQFSTDPLALAIAKGAVERGYDKKFEQPRRGFLYMPFQHSEELEEQRRSLLLFNGLGDAEQLSFAQKHYDVIERFGRFPHRNAMLGRRSTPEEEAFGLSPAW
jgi:uncharacterized protein (DUF924 family)